MQRVVILAAGIAALAAGSVRAAPGEQRPPVSPVIYPPQQVPLTFSHARHLALGADCAACHPGAASSRSSLDDLMPREAACRVCHAIDRAQPERTVAAGEPPARCDACHVGYAAGAGVARVSIPPPNLKFDHGVHATAGIACGACHGDLSRVERATRAQLPSMATCLGCHAEGRAASQCARCHLSSGGGRLVTEFASGTLVPGGSLRGDAHSAAFRRDHAAAAQNASDYCETCHGREFCVSCHRGSVKPMDFHVGDYVSLHAVEARRNVPDCSACHRGQSFCVGCHSRTGVAFDGRGSEFRDPATGALGARFHPPGWTATPLAGDNLHGVEAQRNINTCASCHREQFCVTCHSAEPGAATRANPHPPGWATSRRCAALRDRNLRMCLRCHLDPAEARCE